MREIALDTETTGLNPDEGHRIVEIGCVELVDGLPTGQEFHAYINPQRDVPPEASAISGLTREFLQAYPVLADVVDAFLDFIGVSPLIIHNARFDMSFINAELRRLNYPVLSMTRAVDTVALARRRFPGSPAHLNALCRRFHIDLSVRDKHGALVDARLLAQVYRALQGFGGRQSTLVLGRAEARDVGSHPVVDLHQGTAALPVRIFCMCVDEFVAHQKMLEGLNHRPLWNAMKEVS